MANGLIKKLRETGKNAWKAIKDTGETILEYRKPIRRVAGLTLLGGILTFMPAKVNADTFYISPDNPSINAIIGYECSVKLPTPENPHIFNLWDESTGKTGVYDDQSAQFDGSRYIINNQLNCKINAIINLTPDYKLDTTKPNTIVLQTIKCWGNNEVTNLAREQSEDYGVGVWFDGDNITIKNVYVYPTPGITLGTYGFYSRANHLNNLIDSCIADGCVSGVNTDELANTKIRNCIIQNCDWGFVTLGHIDMGRAASAIDQADPGNNVIFKSSNNLDNYLGWIFYSLEVPIIPAEGNWWYDENGILLTSEAEILNKIGIQPPPSPNSGLENYLLGPSDRIDVWPCKQYDFFNPPTSVSDGIWNMYWNFH